MNARRVHSNEMSRSVLRAEVLKLDKSKSKRTFTDKEEWKTVLKLLQTEGVLTYLEPSDKIMLGGAEPAAEEDSSDDPEGFPDDED